MATAENICKFNQTGFCKFLTRCRKQHLMEICPNKHCSNITCLLRHPRACRYFANFGRCKFGGTCFYLHENEINTVNGIDVEIKSRIEKLEIQVKLNVELINHFQTIYNNEVLEMKKELNKQAKMIDNLEVKVQSTNIASPRKCK